MAEQNQVRDVSKGPSIRLSTVATSTRQTPKTDFGSVLRDGLVKASNVAMDGIRVAAPFIPGTAILSAAVAGANLASSFGPGGQAGGGAVDGIQYGGPSYGPSSFANTGGFGVSAGGLSGGTGPTGSGVTNPGSYSGGGTLTLPTRGPGLGTDMSQPPSNFAPNGAGGTGNPNFNGAPGAPGDAFSNMMTATKSMAEFQASFNLQYLQLQEKIQQDTRQFNLVSNIMKTKHDAAKNALNNVR